jgi:hypothetical protein
LLNADEEDAARFDPVWPISLHLRYGIRLP